MKLQTCSNEITSYADYFIWNWIGGNLFELHRSASNFIIIGSNTDHSTIRCVPLSLVVHCYQKREYKNEMWWLRWQSGGFLPGGPGFNSRHFWFRFLRSVSKRNLYLMVTSQVINNSWKWYDWLARATEFFRISPKWSNWGRVHVGWWWKFSAVGGMT